MAENSNEIANPRRGKNLQLIGIGLFILSMPMFVIFLAEGSSDEPGGFLLVLSGLGAPLLLFTGAITTIVGAVIHWYHWH